MRSVCKERVATRSLLKDPAWLPDAVIVLEGCGAAESGDAKRQFRGKLQIGFDPIGGSLIAFLGGEAIGRE